MLFGQSRTIDSTGAPWLSSTAALPLKQVAGAHSTQNTWHTGIFAIPAEHVPLGHQKRTAPPRRRPAHYVPLQRGPRNLIILGTDAVARDVQDYFTGLPQLGYTVRGLVPVNTASQDAAANGIDDVITIARSRFVEDLLFSSRPEPGQLKDLLTQARAHDISVRYIPNVSETLRRAHEIEYIGDLPTIVLYRNIRRTLPLVTKRCIDVFSALLAIVLLSPVLLGLAAAIKLSSPGPVLYASQRVGRKGRLFTCYKFRTMVVNAEALRKGLLHLNEREGVLFKMAKDPRITSIGRVLRKYSFDELPQLWNVLRGDMSLVGPRPSIQSEVAQYQTAHFRRLDVVPGMTGLWQVEARHDPSFESYIQLDSQYVSDWSILLDLKILLRTLRVVVLGTGV